MQVLQNELALLRPPKNKSNPIIPNHTRSYTPSSRRSSYPKRLPDDKVSSVPPASSSDFGAFSSVKKAGLALHDAVQFHIRAMCFLYSVQFYLASRRGYINSHPC